MRIRFPFMASAMLSLLIGLVGGLARLGWFSVPPGLSAWHGPVMVSGFLGTVISLERAVALGAWWASLAPAGSAVGVLALLVGLPWQAGAAFALAGSLGLTAIYAVLYRRHRTAYTAVMGIAALCWVGSNVIWLRWGTVWLLVPFWMGFVGLTIAGERLELSRMRPASKFARILAGVATGTVLAGLLLSGATVQGFDAGVRIVGVGFFLWTLWLTRYDVAFHTVRGRGLTRFVAVCLLTGYVWLGVSGILLTRFGGWVDTLPRDAILHTFFVGFVLSMIFGHAPIILPAVLGGTMRFGVRFYAPLALLHGTLALRIFGDLTGWEAGRLWGGMGNALVVLLFLANTATAMRWKSAEAKKHGSKRTPSFPTSS